MVLSERGLMTDIRCSRRSLRTGPPVLGQVGLHEGDTWTCSRSPTMPVCDDCGRPTQSSPGWWQRRRSLARTPRRPRYGGSLGGQPQATPMPVFAAIISHLATPTGSLGHGYALNEDTSTCLVPLIQPTCYAPLCGAKLSAAPPCLTDPRFPGRMGMTEISVRCTPAASGSADGVFPARDWRVTVLAPHSQNCISGASTALVPTARQCRFRPTPRSRAGRTADEGSDRPPALVQLATRTKLLTDARVDSGTGGWSRRHPSGFSCSQPLICAALQHGQTSVHGKSGREAIRVTR